MEGEGKDRTVEWSGVEWSGEVAGMGEERHLYSSMYQLVSTFGHLVFEIALNSSNGQRRYL